MKELPLTDTEDRARLVLRRLMAFRMASGAALARRTGYTPQTISNKLSGGSVISLTDAVRFAEALDVDPSVFLMEPDDAVRWALDHPTREVGHAQLSLVLGMAVSAAVALAGARVPSIAPVLQSIAENGGSDDVMSSNTPSGKNRYSCGPNPTASDKTVCRPRTYAAHNRPRPDHFMRTRSSQRTGDASECLGQR